MPTSTLSSKSQIVVPAEVRRKMGIKPGDRLTVEIEGDHIVIRKAPKTSVEALSEFRSKRWKGFAKELRQARDEWDR